MTFMPDKIVFRSGKTSVIIDKIMDVHWQKKPVLSFTSEDM